MLSSNFIFWNILFLFIYLYFEFFYSILFLTIYKNLKFFNLNYTKKLINSIFKSNVYHFINFLLIFFLITLKVNYVDNSILSYIIVYLFISLFLLKFFKHNISFINFNVIFFLFFFLFINNYITFFLFIELYSIIFYFFFLNIRNNNKLFLVQYKNMLLLYLLNNFFTSILFLFGTIYVVNFYGTINFTELDYLNDVNSYWQIYLLIISFCLKISLPGFHFLKIEIYKYLNIDIVIFFSVITIYINYMFMIFFFNQNIIFVLLNNYKFLNLLLLLVFFFFLQKLKINNFQEFISYSGFATNNLIILNFLI